MPGIRNLHVLDINDQPTEEFASGYGDAQYFEVTRIESWTDVQEVLSENRGLSPDLILTDVSFDRDDSVRLAVIPGTTDPDAMVQQAIVPVGPLLALCFLQTRPIISFGFYSAHMTAPQLSSYPPFLVAMGLLAAKAEGRVFLSKHLSHMSGRDDLDAYVAELSTFLRRSAVLEVALRGYRQNLAAKLKTGEFRVLNALAVTQWLRSFREAFERDSDALDRIDIPKDTHLWIWGGGAEDRISLRSVFADLLKWSTSYVHKPGIPAFLNWFGDVCDPDPCWSYALRFMRLQMEQKDRRRRVDYVLKEWYPDLPAETLHETFRLCVLFANIQAWLDEGGEPAVHPQRSKVYDYLGTKEQRTYQEWFNERPRKEPSTATSRPRKAVGPARTLVSYLGIPPLPVFNDEMPAGDVGRCFLERDTLLSQEDDLRVEEYRKFVQKAWYTQFGKPYAVAVKATPGA